MQLFDGANEQACCRWSTCEPAFFKALAEPNRIALLMMLAQCGRPCSVGQLSECCPVDLSVVSRHLATLKKAGVVKSERQGKEVYYEVCYGRLVGTLRELADAIEACCPDHLEEVK